ncbi:hypothetical protein HWI79_1276, partial [Cryptosporidium felis]
MEIALKNQIKGTPNGPFLYPYNVRGKKPFSLLTDDEGSESSGNSSDGEENLGMGAKVKCIYDNELYKHDTEEEENHESEPKTRIQETMYEYKSRRTGKEVEYICREDAFDIQYAKDFEFFFGVPYNPYIRLSRYRFGRNMKYPRDLKQEKAVYEKNPRYLFNDPWPEIDVSKPIPYVKQKQPQKLVNERGIPIVWLDIIEKSKRFNVRKGNNSLHNIESQSKNEPAQTLGDAVVAWEVSSTLLNGDLPSIIGEDKKSRKQKRFSFVRDNIRGVAEEIESWTKCPVVQTEMNKHLENSWKNIDKQAENKTENSSDLNDKNLKKSGSMKSELHTAKSAPAKNEASKESPPNAESSFASKDSTSGPSSGPPGASKGPP